ncbi:MAG: ion transporter [Lachnospiraceae bacterium]|nr:ion transporter [Lachnospiraceae bacterium]
MIEVGYVEDAIGRGYDFLNLGAIIVNLTVSIMMTFDELMAVYGPVLKVIEAITVAFFAIDYVLRVWTAPELYLNHSRFRATLRYLFSFNGIVDLLSFLPYYLPVFFPAGAVAFRMFRVMRIFRLFRLNAYYDSLNVITEVIVSKGRQLLSSIFVILAMMLASSLCMYSLEHQAQPEVFDNAFSGIWWAANTLLTVGYGDIYPVTPAGRVMGVIIAFLGVGVVAIPTGIISAGFVEQYTRLKKIGDNPNESELRFIKVTIDPDDPWYGKKISELKLSTDILVATVLREGKSLVPRGDLLLKQGDVLVLAAEHFHDDSNITLKEVVLKKNNPWVGVRIRDLAISRMTYIISVKRGRELMIPRGEMILQENDRLLLYTKEHLPDAHPVAMRQS